MRRRQSLAYSATTFGNTWLLDQPNKYFYNYVLPYNKITVSQQNSFKGIFYNNNEDYYNQLNLYWLKYFTNLNELIIDIQDFSYIYVLLPENIPNNSHITIEGDQARALYIGYFGDPKNLKKLNISVISQDDINVSYYILNSNKYSTNDFNKVYYPTHRVDKVYINAVKPYTDYFYNYYRF